MSTQGDRGPERDDRRQGLRAWPAASAPDQIHAGLNYPYDIRWTGSHGSYRERRALELACPLLFIYGRGKPFHVSFASVGSGFCGPGGCKVIAPDTGHWVMREKPAEVNDAILGWMG